ncbi:Signal peptidase [Flavobacterium longum]|uniref:hypothetical protein n=1 Tax=Flavobacterium longum TaxID=1299340 RepID=UPI0039E792A4
MKKNNFFKFYVLAAMLLFDFVVFAQGGPGDDDDNGDLEGDDAPPVPVNGKLIWLAITGIVFAIYIFRSYNRKEEA